MYIDLLIMSMISIKNKFVNFLYPVQYAYAHCDIPCGIYDLHTAQLDALTVVRMNQLINDLDILRRTHEEMKMVLKSEKITNTHYKDVVEVKDRALAQLSKINI